jgi:transcriptional regulator with XRE-family HTH domain
MIEDDEIIKVNQYLLNHKNEFNKEMGTIFKNYRMENNILLSEISLNSMMSSDYIIKIEKGEIGISFLKFVILCNSLQINPSYILNDFLYSSNKNEDILFYQLQKDKNISKNISEFMKLKY